MVDPEVLDKIKRACCPQKAIYDIANYVETDIIPPINEATNTANAAAAQANSAYNRATDALNTANAVAEDVSRSLVDLNASGDGSTVTLNAPRNTGNPATAPLPVADATKAGVMNSATYVNLQNLNTRVSSLENQTTTYVVSFTNDNPTQDEINNAYKTAYPTAPFPPIDGTTVIDSTRQLYYRWVKNGAIWLKTTGFVISQFTNETAGTIKGSTVAGQIQAETDGTGSLVGYDQIKNDITANATGIQTLTANLGTTNTNVTNLDGRVTAVEGRVNNSLIALSSKSDATGVTITGTKQAGQPSETQIPVASATQSGIVTPTMFNAWNAGGLKPLPITFVTLNTTDKTAQDLSQNPNFTVRLIVENNELRLYVKNDSPVTRTMRVYLFGMKGLNSINCTTGLGGVRNLDQGREATMDLSTSGMANYYEISWGNETHILYTYKIWQTNNALTWPIYYCEQAFE